MRTIKKVIIVFVCSLIYTAGFSQFTLIPGQPEDKSLYNHTRIDDNLTFLSYAIYDDSNNFTQSLFSFNGETVEEIMFDGANTRHLDYIGTLNNRYYFGSFMNMNEYLLEYNRDTHEGTSISLPGNSYDMIFPVATMNDKLYFITGMYDLKSYDGNEFEVIDKPAPPTYNFWRSYYSTSQSLLYFLYRDQPQNDSKLYTYDGADFNQIHYPGNITLGTFFDEFDSKVIITGENRDSYYDYQLYSCDGNTLTHLNAGEDKQFYLATPRYKDDKRYYNYKDVAVSEFYFYEYDGTNLSPIASYPEHGNGNFLSEFNGKDYFGIYNNALGKSMLYSYDGENLTLIEPEGNERPLHFAGILDNKLYTLYNKEEMPHVLNSYSAATNEVLPVPNVPEFSSLSHLISFQNTLIYRIYPSNDSSVPAKYYAMTSSNEFFELQVPGYHRPLYRFNRGNKLYFDFTNQDNSIYKLFSWEDNILNVTEFANSKNEALIFPNPAKETLSVQLPSYANSREVALNIYSIDGKQMGTHLFENNSGQIDFSVSHLAKGVYVLKITDDSGSVYKKFIKN